MNTDNGAVRIYARVGHHGQLIKVATVVVDGLEGPARTEHVAETLEQLAAKIRLDGVPGHRPRGVEVTAKVVRVPVLSIEELDRVAELTERINPLSARCDQVRRRYPLTPATLDERLEAHVQQVDQQHNGEDDGGDDRYPVQDDVDGVGEHGRQDERDQ